MKNIAKSKICTLSRCATEVLRFICKNRRARTELFAQNLVGISSTNWSKLSSKSNLDLLSCVASCRAFSAYSNAPSIHLIRHSTRLFYCPHQYLIISLNFLLTKKYSIRTAVGFHIRSSQPFHLQTTTPYHQPYRHDPK
jgi:hypothetical protein